MKGMVINMPKRLTPYEKVENFITKCHDAEVDKWNAGLSNNADEWDRFIEYWSLIDEVESLRKDNAELRMYNNKLLDENKKVKQQLENSHNNINIVLSQYYNGECDAENTIAIINEMLHGGE